MKPGATRAQRYPQVSFGKGGTRDRRYVHELVLTTFVGPRPDGMLVRHLNDIPTDNRLENLAWGTKSENQQDWRRRCEPKSHCPWGHKLELPNLTKEFFKNGARHCLACNRARARSQRSGVPCDQEMRDAYYEEIMVA